MFDLKKIFTKKEETVDQATLDRQKIIDQNRLAVTKLKELRDLMKYLLNEANGKTSRKQRRQIREQFLRDDAFGPDIIEQAIKFFERRLAVLDELDKRKV